MLLVYLIATLSSVVNIMSRQILKDRKDYEFESQIQQLINKNNSGEKELDVNELLTMFENNNKRLYKHDGF